MIRTIIVDLGGVYFTNGTPIALKKIYKLVSVPKNIVDEIFESGPKKEGYLYRKGKLSKNEFWNIAMKKLRVDSNLADKMRNIWFSSYTPNKGMKHLIQKLRKRYFVIAFSDNTKERIDYLDGRYGLKRDFDDFIFSFETGLSKKEPKFYKLLLEEVKSKPEECVFVDDKEKNLILAKKLGINTILFENSKQFEKELRSLGVTI